VGKARRVTDDNPHTSASVSSGGKLLDTTVVERDTCGALVLDENLSKPCSVAKRNSKRPLHHRFVDERRATHRHTCLLRFERRIEDRQLAGLGHLDAQPIESPSWPRDATPRIVTGVTTQTDLHAGLIGRAEMTVCDCDTATSAGSGDVDVLGTPRLIALCEEATTAAIAHVLPTSWTTVAMRVRFDHLAPVAVGTIVHAEATLERVEGRRLVFTVSASDLAGLVGAGRVTRVAVERDRFIAKAR